MKTLILLGLISYASAFALAGTQKMVIPVPAETVNTASFKFIRGHKQGKNITINWGMNNNSGVCDFVVESTYEDPNDPHSVWGTIEMIPCTNSPIFKSTSYPELPGTLNFRVIAIMNNNSMIISPVYSVDIVQ